jgi:hypothetical protein
MPIFMCQREAQPFRAARAWIVEALLHDLENMLVLSPRNAPFDPVMHRCLIAPLPHTFVQ